MAPQQRARLVGLASAAVLAMTSPSVAGAVTSSFPSSTYLTGNWDGLRDHWQQRGFAVDLNYTSEPMWNLSGGERRGGTYTQNLGLGLHFDLAKLFRVPATTLLIKLAKRDGDSVSAEYVAPSEGGNLFPVQQIYGGQTWHLVNVQLNTALLDERLDLAYGRIVANDDFLRSPLYCQFLNNAICGSPKAVFFENPFAFSAYPSAQWGLRARYDTPDRHWTLQAAIYDADINLQDGNPAATPHNQHGDSWGFGDNGVVLAGELQYHHLRDSNTGLPGTYKVGGFWMNGDYQDLSRTDDATVNGNAMLWLLADQRLYRAEPGSERGLSALTAWVISLEDKANLLDQQVSLGLVYQGPLPGRDQDSAGLMFSKGWVTDQRNRARRASGFPTQHAESVLELNYKIVLGHGITLQPDIQYIFDPAGSGQIDDAFLVGAQVTVDF